MVLGAVLKLRVKDRQMAIRITGKQTRSTLIEVEQAFQKATQPVHRRTRKEEKRFIIDTVKSYFHCKGSRFSLYIQTFYGWMYKIENSVYELTPHTLFDTADIDYFPQTMKLIFLILRGSQSPIFVPFPCISIDHPIALLPTR